MATSTVTTPTPPSGSDPRGGPGARTLRKDGWWVQPTITAAVLLGFIVYSTWRAFENKYFFGGAHGAYGASGAGASRDYISPFYSPCVASSCPSGARWFSLNVARWISPAIYILIFPLGFRLTCYYYRKAYYRSFWLSPPACAVAEPHKRYTGERRFPLILQNLHRLFLYFATIFNVILTYDAIIAFRFHGGIGMGLGTLVLIVNAVLLWLYTLSCHSCRHLVGGRLNHFSKHPIRYKLWTFVSRLNPRHSNFAWMSLIWVALADFYIREVVAGVFHDPRFF